MAGAMPNFLARLMRPFTSSTNLSVNPEGTAAAQIIPEKTCTVAAGCFWGVEHIFRQHFQGKGLLDAKVGYIGGLIKTRDGKEIEPTYRVVCGGSTGYAEALQVTFDPSIVTYSTLIEFFYRMHNPTTKDRQGADQGTQYRSAIFYHTPEQEQEAKSVTEKVQKQWWKAKITTDIVEASRWYDAEAYHQLYLDNNPGGYQCPSHKIYDFKPLE
ncbi:Peptide-methionine (S)-S-oxide reductase [Pseudocyphellaria aurata]|nr:Peptide-methionine (S)-S-oxide reductase [Pseudocyphellaria aurata]